MQKAFLSLLFAAALPGLSTAGECRPWRLPNGVWLQSCAEDTWVKAGYDYEFIGPGILYTNPNGAPSLYYDPARWIRSYSAAAHATYVEAVSRELAGGKLRAAGSAPCPAATPYDNKALE